LTGAPREIILRTMKTKRKTNGASSIRITVKTRRALRKISNTVRRNRPRVERQFARSGVRAGKALTLSAAKYYTTLRRLANE
jgi:hypothetical protein